MARVKYPIGIQTFSDIISGGYVYVDKTEFVYDISDRYRYVFLSRPRRFGKSLLMSTLEAYFKGKNELFRGLAIEHLEKDWIKYPVLRFDFSPANYINTSRLQDRIKGCLNLIAEYYSL